MESKLDTTQLMNHYSPDGSFNINRAVSLVDSAIGGNGLVNSIYSTGTNFLNGNTEAAIGGIFNIATKIIGGAGVKEGSYLAPTETGKHTAEAGSVAAAQQKNQQIIENKMNEIFAKVDNHMKTIESLTAKLEELAVSTKEQQTEAQKIQEEINKKKEELNNAKTVDEKIKILDEISTLSSSLEGIISQLNSLADEQSDLVEEVETETENAEATTTEAETAVADGENDLNQLQGQAQVSQANAQNDQATGTQDKQEAARLTAESTSTFGIGALKNAPDITGYTTGAVIRNGASTAVNGITNKVIGLLGSDFETLFNFSDSIGNWTNEFGSSIGAFNDSSDILTGFITSLGTTITDGSELMASTIEEDKETLNELNDKETDEQNSTENQNVELKINELKELDLNVA